MDNGSAGRFGQRRGAAHQPGAIDKAGTRTFQRKVVLVVRVLVSGGGIAGLAAATALTRHGVDVDLVERSETWRTNGAGILLNPNGERVLRDLELDVAVGDAGFRVETARMMDITGRSRGEFPYGRWPGVGGSIAIHREALQKVLVEASSRARLSLGTTISAIADGDGGAQLVTFDDGSVGEYDVVVVAEGIRSTTRAAVFGAVQPRPVGQMYWRAAVPGRLVDVVTMVSDQDRYVALLPLGGGITYIAVQTRSAPIAIEPGARLTSMRAATEGIAGPVHAVIDAIGSDDEVFVGPAEELDKIHWRRSRVALIGDASHALSPALNQGANLAMEDAYVLADELASTQNIDAALDGFVARREPRVAFVRDRVAERIALLNNGADQREMLAALQLVEARLSAPI